MARIAIGMIVGFVMSTGLFLILKGLGWSEDASTLWAYLPCVGFTCYTHHKIMPGVKWWHGLAALIPIYGFYFVGESVMAWLQKGLKQDSRLDMATNVHDGQEYIVGTMRVPLGSNKEQGVMASSVIEKMPKVDFSNPLAVFYYDVDSDLNQSHQSTLNVITGSPRDSWELLSQRRRDQG